MKLSIVIVSYNEREYLEETIESCLRQDIQEDYEIIIGDDGSTDGSIELIKEYYEKYPDIIRFFVMDRDDSVPVIASMRVSNVLKRAFGLSQGEYITAVSGDDILLDKSKLSKQIMFLDSNIKYVSCYTDYKMFGADMEDDVCQMKTSISNSFFWACNYMHISCFVFRRCVVEHLLNRFIDDSGLIFCILAEGKSKHITGVDFGYRQRNKSIMHKADRVELSILELLLYQDVLEFGGFEFSSLSRECPAISYLFKNRKKLSNDKYKKYFDIEKEDSVLMKFAHADGLFNILSILLLYLKSHFYKRLFTILLKIQVFIKTICCLD